MLQSKHWHWFAINFIWYGFAAVRLDAREANPLQYATNVDYSAMK